MQLERRANHTRPVCIHHQQTFKHIPGLIITNFWWGPLLKEVKLCPTDCSTAIQIQSVEYLCESFSANDKKSRHSWTTGWDTHKQSKVRFEWITNFHNLKCMCMFKVALRIMYCIHAYTSTLNAVSMWHSHALWSENNLASFLIHQRDSAVLLYIPIGPKDTASCEGN